MVITKPSISFCCMKIFFWMPKILKQGTFLQQNLFLLSGFLLQLISVAFYQNPKTEALLDILDLLGC